MIRSKTQEMRELYAYNRWASERAFEAASALSQEDLTRDLRNSFPSVLATLAHMVGAEWVWLTRWQGGSPTSVPNDWDVSTLGAVRDRWRRVERELSAFVEGLDASALERPLSYKTFTGESFTQPLSHMLRHVVNHSTYHRGQVTTLLRQLGGVPVSTDLIRFYREMGH
jgi:uncharacterized damage-inducible protein DinB